jgi:hypothetical protein
MITHISCILTDDVLHSYKTTGNLNFFFFNLKIFFFFWKVNGKVKYYEQPGSITYHNK